MPLARGARLRRLLFGAGLLVVTVATAGFAYPEHPRPGSKLAGTGVQYLNNSPKWSPQGAEHFTFQVSPDGHEITAFRGSYSYYCGTGTGTISATFIAIHRDGSFSYQFSVPNAVNHKGGQRTYVSITGQFVKNGSVVHLSYLVNTASAIARHPYTASRPATLGCASLIKGTALVRSHSTSTASSS